MNLQLVSEFSFVLFSLMFGAGSFELERMAYERAEQLQLFPACDSVNGSPSECIDAIARVEEVDEELDVQAHRALLLAQVELLSVFQFNGESDSSLYKQAFVQAEQRCWELLAVSPGDSFAFLMLATLAAHSGDKWGRLSFESVATQINSKDWLTHRALARQLEEKFRPEDLVERKLFHLKSAVDSAPEDHKLETAYEYISSLARIGRHSEAEAFRRGFASTWSASNIDEEIASASTSGNYEEIAQVLAKYCSIPYLTVLNSDKPCRRVLPVFQGDKKNSYAGVLANAYESLVETGFATKADRQALENLKPEYEEVTIK